MKHILGKCFYSRGLNFHICKITMLDLKCPFQLKWEHGPPLLGLDMHRVSRTLIVELGHYLSSRGYLLLGNYISLVLPCNSYLYHLFAQNNSPPTSSPRSM